MILLFFEGNGDTPCNWEFGKRSPELREPNKVLEIGKPDKKFMGGK
jgi:hypothetical protein